MYVKVHRSLWEGSMVGRADAQLVFIFLMSHADAEGFVEKKQELIAALTGISTERVQAALDYLERPDADSRTPDLDGRRLERIDGHRTWGWRIVNAKRYREMRNSEDRKEQNRDAQRRRRSDARLTPADSQQSVSTNADSVPQSAHVEVEGEVRRIKTLEADPQREGNDEATEARAAFAGAEQSDSPSGLEDEAQQALLIGTEPGPVFNRSHFLTYPTKVRGQGHVLTVGQVEAWERLFTSCDVRLELRNAFAWCVANTAKRKTADGMDRFLVRWLTKGNREASERRAGPGADPKYVAQVRVIGGNGE